MIYINGKPVTLMLNGKAIMSVMRNGKKIYPSESTNGVFICDNNGLIHDIVEWNSQNSQEAVGVVVVTDDCSFLISKDMLYSNSISWSDQLWQTNVNNLTDYASGEEAKTDFNGANNTDIIISAAYNDNASNNAAIYARSQTITINNNNINGYLPSAGELNVIHKNKDRINLALDVIGVNNMDTIFGESAALWSSTERNFNTAYVMDYSEYLSGNIIVPRSKSYDTAGYFVLPVFPFNIE